MNPYESPVVQIEHKKIDWWLCFVFLSAPAALCWSGCEMCYLLLWEGFTGEHLDISPFGIGAVSYALGWSAMVSVADRAFKQTSNETHGEEPVEKWSLPS
jgi:hypothetical protein